MNDDPPQATLPQVDLDAFLARHGIAAPRFAHPAVMTVEESDRLVPKLPGAKTKNLFLRDKKGTRHLLCTIAADRPVDLNGLGEALVGGRVGFASPARLLRHLGITPGSVSLLALVNTATLCIAHADLVKFLAATGHAPRVIDIPERTAAPARS
jgi:Ala-tRNA(Pro) deacylase